MRGARLVLGVALIANTLISQEAWAQTDVEQSEAAFEEGTTAFDERRFEDSLRSFQQSYDRLPADYPNRHVVLFNVGRCLEELGRTDEAIAHYERFLAGGGASPEHTADAQGRIDALRRASATTRGTASGTEAEADRAPRSASADDGLVIGGLIVGGVGAALGIASFATGLVAHGIYTDLEVRCVPVTSCPAGSQDDIDSGESLAIASTVLLPISIAALGAGIVMAILGLTSSGGEPEQAALRLDVGLGSLTLSGGF